MDESKYNKESCDCRVVTNYEACQKPGDFYIMDHNGALHWSGVLPGNTHCCIPIRLGANNPGMEWGWDGNRDQPTLTPSIHSIGHWHGWLRNGKLQSC